MTRQLPGGILRRQMLARPLTVKIGIGRQELLPRRFLQGAYPPEVHAEEGLDAFGMLAGEGLVRQQERRLTGVALAGKRHGLQAAALRFQREGSPEGHGVSLTGQKGLQRLILRHVLEDDVLFRQPQRRQPPVYHIVRGRPQRAEDGLAAYRPGRARHFRIKGVIPGVPQHGTVLAGIDAGREGLVIAYGDDLRRIFQRGRQGRQGAAGSDLPGALPHAGHEFPARLVKLHVEPEAGFHVPAVLAGVPRGKGFMLHEPCGPERIRRFAAGGLRQTCQQQKGQKRGKHCSHSNLLKVFLPFSKLHASRHTALRPNRRQDDAPRHGQPAGQSAAGRPVRGYGRRMRPLPVVSTV